MDAGLTAWISELFRHPLLLRMGHNQRADDLNLGLGWLYYSLGRILRPRRAVVIGSWRGFVPLVLGRALQDNLEGGEVVFIDPSLVDDFWKEPEAVRRHFEGFGVRNVRHHRMTTQEFVGSGERDRLGPVGLLFIDGYHSEEQVRFDYRAFEALLEERGMALFHDSMLVRTSGIYGKERAYETRVVDFLATLREEPGIQLLDLPFGSGLTLLRKVTPASSVPRNESSEERA